MPGIPSQQFAVPFIQGVDTKTDPKAPAVGRLLEAVNCTFRNPGAIESRWGFTEMPRTIVPGGDKITTGKHIHSFGNQLMVFNGTNGFSWSEGQQGWVNKGFVPLLTESDLNVVNNAHNQTNVVNAHLDGINLYAWQDSRGGIRCSAVDEQTGNIVLNDILVNVHASSPRVVATSEGFIIYYCNGFDIKARRYVPSNSNVLEEEVVVIQAVLKLGVQYIDVARKPDDSSTVAIGYTNEDNNPVVALVDRVTFIASTECNPEQSFMKSVSWDSGGSIWALVTKTEVGSTVLYATPVDPSLMTVGDPISLGPGPAYDHVVAVEADAVTYTMTTVASFHSFTDPDDTSIAYSAQFRYDYSTNQAVIVKLATPLLRGASLASKPFVQDAHTYVQLVRQTKLQSTYYTYDLSANMVVGRDRIGVAGAVNTKVLPAPAPLSGSTWRVACSDQNMIVSNGGVLSTLCGAASTLLDFDPPASMAELDNSLLIAGACPQLYDGATFTEEGFNWYPDGLIDHSTAPGIISAGTYSYKLVYAWIDNTGKVWRSAPSPGDEVVLTGDFSVVLTVPTLRLTTKSNVWVEVYRTPSNSQTYYLVTDPINVTYNTTTADTVTFTDNTLDINLVGNAILYTQLPATVENKPLPGCRTVTVYSNRFFVGGLSYDEDTLAFSQLSIPGKAIEFADEFVVQVDSPGGGVTALCQLDEKLIVFKDHLIYFTAGDGPNSAGGGQQYPTPQLIAGGVGNRDGNSVVLYGDGEEGLMFKSDKGIYMLDRGLKASYIGVQVEAYNGLTITGAVLLADRNQVRFTTEAAPKARPHNPGLAYDYLVNQWSPYTNHDARSCCSWLQPDGSGVFMMLKPDGRVWKEAPNTWSDPVGVYTFGVKTGWIQPKGQSGWFDARRINIIGEYKGSHDLQVSLFYDFSPDPFQVKQIPATAVFTQKTAGGNWLYDYNTEQPVVPLTFSPYQLNTWGNDKIWGGQQGYLSGGAGPGDLFGMEPVAFGMGSYLFGMSLGSGSYYVPTGSLADVWGGRWTPYEFGVRCSKTHTNAFAVAIYALPDGAADRRAPTGQPEGLTISSICLDWADLGGSSRLGRSRSF